jgi:hypothetical protein
MTKTTIVVEISKGLVDVASHRGAPCRVIIRDYDIDGIDSEELVTSANGLCVERVIDLQQEPRPIRKR